MGGKGSVAPGHAGIDLRADVQKLDLQSMDASARGFSAGKNQLARAAFHKPTRDGRERSLNDFSGLMNSESLLHGVYAGGIGSGIDQQRERRIARPAIVDPGERGADLGVKIGGELQRIYRVRISAGADEMFNLIIGCG